MEIIQITDKDLGLQILPTSNMETRNSVRVVLIDEDNHIGVIYSKKLNYHKLPGGGMEGNENEEESLRRETLEETGYEIRELQKIITIEEFRTHDPVHQFSFCYKAKTKGQQKSTNLQGYEATQGFTLRWYTISEILKILSDEYPSQPYHGKFMNLRDRKILERI